MDRSSFFGSKGYDWEKGRKLFIESAVRPTYEEVAKEVGCAVGSVSRLSAEEGWPALRAQHFEQALAKADASAVILEAIKADRTIVTGITSFAITMVASLSRCVESIKEENSASTKAQALNTASFAMKNLAEALKAVGIVGIAKKLGEDGSGNGGRWDPKILNQINLTVQQAKDGLKVVEGATTEVEAKADKPSVS